MSRDDQLRKTRKTGIANSTIDELWNIAMKMHFRLGMCRADGDQDDYDNAVELLGDLLTEIRGRYGKAPDAPGPSTGAPAELPVAMPTKSQRKVERVRAALVEANGNRSAAARALGISVGTLAYYVRHYRIAVEPAFPHADVTDEQIVLAMTKTDGNVAAAARRLGMTRKALWARVSRRRLKNE